jgi:glyoxylase-like metal-dependent hydrolase (beta-lactamase superfamily II)/rhodanese-related sulfurtransferase
MAKDFNLKQFAAGSCYSYILSSQSEALIIDPHISLPSVYSKYLEKKHLKLKYIIDTHTHADHFSLASVLKKKYNAPVLMSEKAVSQVADQRLKENDEISLGSKHFKVLYTPGHTDDATSIYGEGRLFTGDVLLIGSVGRTDFQNGSPESMFDTLQNLKKLPGETIVFPAHDYHEKKSSTIAQEKQTNPFMKEPNKEAMVQNMRSKEMPKPFNIDNIVRVNQKGEAVSLEMISPKEAHQLVSKDPSVKLLDVRTAIEYSDVRIDDSINIPIDGLSARLDELAKTKQNYIVFCRTGNRSPMAADMLVQSGIQNVKVMEGGMIRWQKERLPVTKGVGGISLERQVRVIAGLMVLAGTLLGLLVNKWFFAIPIFASSSLTFAGLTDNCLMGKLLMKLPYNKNMYKAKLGGGTCAMG